MFIRQMPSDFKAHIGSTTKSLGGKSQDNLFGITNLARIQILQHLAMAMSSECPFCFSQLPVKVLENWLLEREGVFFILAFASFHDIAASTMAYAKSHCFTAGSKMSSYSHPILYFTQLHFICLFFVSILEVKATFSLFLMLIFKTIRKFKYSEVIGTV